MGLLEKCAQEVVEGRVDICDPEAAREVAEIYNSFPNGHLKAYPDKACALYRALMNSRDHLRAAGLDFDLIPDITDVDILKVHFGPIAQMDEKGIVKLVFPFSWEAVEAIKALPGCTRKWDKDQKAWLVSFLENDPPEIARGVYQLEELFNEFEFTVDEGTERMIELTKERIDKLEKEQEAAAAAALKTEAEDRTQWWEMGKTLRPYQAAGCFYGITAKRVFLADQMGLGKTPQAMGIMEALTAYPAIIVVRASLKTNWLRELRDWLPNRVVESDKMTGTADIYVFTHHQLVKVDKESAIAKQWPEIKTFVIDESHDFRGKKSQRTKAAKRLCKKSAPPVRLLLSGTPTPNSPADLIPQLEILDRLGEFGGFWPFAKRYCDAKKTHFGWDFSGAGNLTELNGKLRASCFIRRMKTDVLKELPEKEVNVLEIDVNNRAEYERSKEEVKRKLVELKTRKAVKLKIVLAQIANAETDKEAGKISHEFFGYEPQEGETRESLINRLRGLGSMKIRNVANAEAIMLLNMLRQKSAEGKIEFLLEWSREHFANEGGPMIVFSDHIESQRAVEAKLSEAGIPTIWTRGNKVRSSQDAVDRFQRGEADVLSASLQGDNAGLNITRATTVIHLTRGWIPADHEQAEDRAHRMGQLEKVSVFYLDGKDTIDSMVAMAQARKIAVTRETMDGENDSTDPGDERRSAIRAVLKELLD